LEVLSRGDYSAVDAILKNWHTESADLYWVVRKAGVVTPAQHFQAAFIL
jgi:hypothetical protein